MGGLARHRRCGSDAVSLLVLIPLSLAMGALGLGAFFWALHHHQFDDPDGAAWRVIPPGDDRDEPAHPKE